MISKNGKSRPQNSKYKVDGLDLVFDPAKAEKRKKEQNEAQLQG
jgi:hypothetical protein